MGGEGEDKWTKSSHVPGNDRSSTNADGIGEVNTQKPDVTDTQSRYFLQPSMQVISDVVAFADFLLILAMSVIAKSIYVNGFLQGRPNIWPYLYAGLLGACVFIVYSRRQGAYESSCLSGFGGQVPRIAVSLAVAAFVLLGIAYSFKFSSEYSRGWMGTWFVLSFFSIVLNRSIVARILKRWISIGAFSRRIVVYGSGEIAQKLVESFGSGFLRTRVYGVFDDLVGEALPKVMLTGGLPELLRLCQRDQIDEVLIALPLSEERRIARLVKELSILPVDIRLCPGMAVTALRPKGIVFHGNVAVLELQRRPLEGWSPIVKIFEDRLLASLLLLLLLPIFLLVSLAIKLDSRGPIFFRQKRHGFNHNIFDVWKFRTMTVAEDDSMVVQATRGDQRITRIGRWLRRTSLDELPQLFNVLSGEMSLVGPRPHAVAHNNQYSALLETYAARHKVKPGITGWAQVNGFRGETDTPEKMQKRVECDLHYIENWSLWFDLKILMLTPFSLFGKNAF